jgi:hypothetical protein
MSWKDNTFMIKMPACPRCKKQLIDSYDNSLWCKHCHWLGYYEFEWWDE